MMGPGYGKGGGGRLAGGHGSLKKHGSSGKKTVAHGEDLQLFKS